MFYYYCYFKCHTAQMCRLFINSVLWLGIQISYTFLHPTFCMSNYCLFIFNIATGAQLLSS